MSKTNSKIADGSASANTGAGKEQLRFTNEQFIWRFSPTQTDSELLEAIFVGREPLLQNILEKVADGATSGSTHHVLLYGPRGIGKSHFTSLLHHRLTSDAKLSDAVHIAHLNEDETTTTMVQLLVRIYRSLCKAYPAAYSTEWLDELLNQPPDEIAGVITRRLVARFEKRTLVILVENMNLLFENLGADGQHELRAFFQEHPFASVIATSQQLFHAITDRSEPFFGFFQQIPLKPLSLPDAHQLLMKIAKAKGQDELVVFLDTPDGRGRVRAIHDLAGGNHRVYIVLSGFVTRESLDQLVVPFQKMADELTPYYQERLRSISAQQRQVVELLCREHRTLNPKEIARRLLVDQRTIGKQVRLLLQMGYLTATKRGRETFYELSEPLMRLAYEVKEQGLLEMLIEFLRIWYRPDQMQQLQTTGLCHSTQAYVDAALERSQKHPDPVLKLLLEELETATAEGRSEELAALWEEKAAASNAASDWFQAGYYFNTVNEDHEKAIDCYDKSLELDPENVLAGYNKGIVLGSLGRYEEALDSLNKTLAFDPKIAVLWHLKGSLLRGLGHYEQALSSLNAALELEPNLAHARFDVSEVLFELHRLGEGFIAIREAFAQPSGPLDYLGDVASMFGLIFQLSEDDARLQARLNTLVDLYQKVAKERSLRGQEEVPQRPVFSDRHTYREIRKDFGGASPSLRLEISPLSHLADGLVKSLTKIDPNRVTPDVLESYVTATEQRVADIPEFEIPLRLFRYGIRYLISKKESEFVELIKPERRILRQALGLDPID